jgi:hypothetical protein
MKVTGPDSGSPPAQPAGATDAAEPKTTDRVEGVGTPSGQLFAEKLAAAAATPPAAGAAAGAPAAGAATGPAPIATSEIAADFAAGRVSAQAAVDRVVEQVLSRQLGADAPAAARDQLRAALQEALASDPLLANQLRKLGLATPSEG